jgi:hypothetical protein
MRIVQVGGSNVQVSTGGRDISVMNNGHVCVIQERDVIRVIVSPSWRGIVETVSEGGRTVANYYGPAWLRALRSWYWWWRKPAYRLVWSAGADDLVLSVK